MPELYEEEKTANINQAVTKGINPDVPKKDSGIAWLGEIPEHWEVKRFKYYFNLITEKVEDDLPKIGLENIESKSGKFIETGSDFAGQGVRFRPKDILFGKLRPYLAKVWLSDFDGQAVGDFYVFRSKQEVSPEFAKYRILDSSFIEVTNSSTYGSKMPRVSWEFIADLPIAFPKLHEQQSIVQHIENECALIDAKKAKTEKLIELLTEYRTALISEVVTGKIKVTD
jgi:restriction endonuclease S subunit